MAETLELMEVPAKPRSRGARMLLRRLWRLSQPWLVLLAVLAGWQVATAHAWVRAVFLPSPAVVFATLAHLVVSGELWATLGTSVLRAVAGVVLAGVVGIPLGFAMAEFRVCRWLLSPYVAFGFPLPKIALIPVFTVWLGMDSLSKVVLVFATCVFPFIVAAESGASLVSPKLRWAAQSLGTRQDALFRYVILPATVPALLSGVRIALPIGLITVFTAEMVTGGGLGEAIVQAQRYFQSAQVYAYVLVTMLVGYLADAAIARIQRRFAAWADA
ncbi:MULTISPECIES: ABC transporter permease [Pandoraea]|uniref:ABC transporter permease n=1 Tax=Pandoraea TaxID=93217 RepID=UPI001F5D171E|nr:MULTISPECIES: ABC transporter permease [Pandoraea]